MGHFFPMFYAREDPDSYWFCTQCGAEFHKDDKVEVRVADGEFCSNRCYRFWAAEVYNNMAKLGRFVKRPKLVRRMLHG